MSGRTRSRGLAFPIRKADVGQYRTVARPSKLRRNGMGVTALSVVNGRGAFARAHKTSARKVFAGMSRNARLGRARARVSELKRNGSRPSFMKLAKNGSARSAARAPAKKGKKMLSNRSSAASLKRRGKRLAAFRAAQKRGLSKKSAARSALRKVPMTATERRKSTGFGGVKTRRSPTKKRAGKRRGATASRKGKGASRRRMRRNFAGDAASYDAWNDSSSSGSGGGGKKIPMPRTKSGRRRKRAGAKTKGRRGTTKRRAPAASKRRYRRITRRDPKTGRARKSYMYRTRSGRVRKIPAWAIAGAPSAKAYRSKKYKKARARIAAQRKRAARKIERGQDAFTPNAGAKAVAKKSKKKARKAGRRGSKKTKVRRAKAKGRKANRTAKKRKGTKARRKSSKRSLAAKKAARTRKANKAKRSRAAKKAAKTRRGGKGRRKSASGTRRSAKVARRGAKRKSAKRSRAAKAAWARRRANAYNFNGRRAKRRSLKANRRRAGRRTRRNGRKSMRRNRKAYRRNGRRAMRRNSFFKRNGTVMDLLKTGGLVVTGFLFTKAFSGFVAKAITPYLPASADGTPTALDTWKKPLISGLFGVGAIAVLSRKPTPTKTSVAAGIVTAFLHSSVTALLVTLNQPTVLAALEGYQNSSAYRLRGMGGVRRRRGLRGFERNASSILPRYAPVGAVGFRQAQAGTGEYFASNGMGEYFASSGVKGVGSYEKAGPLALQPTGSRMGNLPIDDGIRPDSNLENVLDLAESAAGLGDGPGYRQAAAGYTQAAAGMGEYYAAKAAEAGGFSEYDIPQTSQVIPNGPLWAGSMSAGDTPTESELPAGILQGPGGNGILSG